MRAQAQQDTENTNERQNTLLNRARVMQARDWLATIGVARRRDHA